MDIFPGMGYLFRMDEQELAAEFAALHEKFDDVFDRLDAIQNRIDTSSRDQRLADALGRRFNQNAADVLKIINEAQGEH